MFQSKGVCLPRQCGIRNGERRVSFRSRKVGPCSIWQRTVPLHHHTGMKKYVLWMLMLRKNPYIYLFLYVFVYWCIYFYSLDCRRSVWSWQNELCWTKQIFNSIHKILGRKRLVLLRWHKGHHSRATTCHILSSTLLCVAWDLGKVQMCVKHWHHMMFICILPPRWSQHSEAECHGC